MTSEKALPAIDSESRPASAHSTLLQKETCCSPPKTACSSQGDLFRMIPKSFSEEVVVTSLGPRLKRTYSSTCRYEGEQQFISSLTLVPRVVPRQFRSTLCVAMPDTEAEPGLVFTETIDFVPRLTPFRYGETIFSFPKDVFTEYTSQVNYWPNYQDQWFTSAVQLIPGEKLHVSTADRMPDTKVPDDCSAAVVCTGTKIPPYMCRPTGHEQVATPLINGEA